MLPGELELDDTGMAQFICLSQNLGHRTIWRNVEVVRLELFWKLVRQQ